MSAATTQTGSEPPRVAGAVATASVATVASATASASNASAPILSLGDLVAAMFHSVQTTVFNRSPTASPVQAAGQTASGVVTGSVGAADPDGDPTAVALGVGPKNGTVVVHTDGSFTYTPSAALAATGGTDSFTVTVSETNADSHIHSLVGLIATVVRALTFGTISPGDGSTISQQISVSVASTGVVTVVTQQRGFAMPTWQIDGYDGPGLKASLEQIKALGATYVEFVPTWYQPTMTSDDISSTPQTVSDAGLVRAITLAHELGLQVFLKPHVDLPDPATQPRSLIAPDDPDAWYASYTTFITHYAQIAEATGVEEFSVGTELDSMTSDTPRWCAVIQAVREQYHGQLTYAAGSNWDTIAFWDKLDIIGVDAYPRLTVTPTTDVETLAKSWQWVVDAAQTLSAKWGKKVLFTEAGFTSQLGTTTDPANWLISTTEGQAEQAAAYQALLSTFTDQPWWGGVFWWVWINPPNATADPLDFSPQGKLAEDVIRQWWAPAPVTAV